MGDYSLKIRITEDDIDKDILGRTVRVFVTGEDRVWRVGIVEAVSSIIPRENIVAIDKRGTFREWFVTVSSRNDVELLDIAGSYQNARSTFSFCPSDKRRVEFRVHRTPRFLKQSVLSQIFEPHGRIISISELSSSEPGAMNLRNGIKVVKMEMREDKLAAVPHFIESEDGAYKFLITSRDRAPLCLRCKCLGHVAGNCVVNNDPKLYSSRVVNAIDNSNLDLASSFTSTSSDDDSMSSSGEGEHMEDESKDNNGLEETEKNNDKEIKETVEGEKNKGENDVINKQAALIEKMAFSDSWSEQVDREEKEKLEKDRTNAKRKDRHEGGKSKVEGGKIRKEKKKKTK
ncbi:hypothetical protein SNE40_004290 [Patella caerulea]|uniref:CCHC-type domain-containing protein n=1 Tax=Patella caerulea TaxID=87958 RepID=A0AAN8J3U3_PATCE